MDAQVPIEALQGDGNWLTVPVDGGKALRMSDGPIGLRYVGEDGKEQVSVAFPSTTLLACSFDRELFSSFGTTLAKEARAFGVDVLLGPGICLQRSPLCGRSFEYASEDPYLSGTLGASYIQGVEKQGVSACLKHFIANSQETDRMTINEVIDERAFRELYARSFEIALQEGKPGSVMASYNQVNGLPVSQNPRILTDLLRTDFSYPGLVMSDWSAVYDPVLSIEAGLDLQMPHGQSQEDEKRKEAYSSHPSFRKAADAALKRLSSFEHAYGHEEKGEPFSLDQDHDEARRMARESIVLLKNEGVLPLSPDDKILVVGPVAKEPHFQGEGSSKVNAYRVPSFLSLLSAVDALYKDGYDLDRPEDMTRIDEVLALLSSYDKVLLFLSTPKDADGEGYDRLTTSFSQAQEELVQKVALYHKKVILVLENGAPVEMAPLVEACSGVVETFFGGEAVNEALFDVLYGVISPSGHLAQTFPVRIADNPSAKNFPGDGFNVFYRESLYVGYRYYETLGKKEQVLFPFGYGLSYTTFAFSSFRIVEEGKVLLAVLKVKNTGEREGKEVVQIYVEKPSSPVFVPKKELAGFAKILLLPGEEKEVRIPLDSFARQYYNIDRHAYVPLYGDYLFVAGENAEDEKEKASYRYEGVNLPSPYDNAKIPFYFHPTSNDFPPEEFDHLAKSLDDPVLKKPEKLGPNDSFHRAILLGKKGPKRLLALLERKGLLKSPSFYYAVLYCPVRVLVEMAPALSGKGEEKLLALLNDEKYPFSFYDLLFFLFKNRSLFETGTH